MGRKKFVLPPGQTVLTFQPISSPSHVVSPPPIDPATCYTPAKITPKWTPKSALVTLNASIPSTRDWTITEMQFFKFSYTQVPYTEVFEYICPSKSLTDAAKEILLSQMSLGGFLDGICFAKM